MPTRLEYWRAAPEEFKALLALQTRLRAGLDPGLFELVCLRVSQINGCAFCVDTHSTQARKAGEPERRLHALVVWRTTSFFSAPERAALEWAEHLTNVHAGPSLDAPFEALRAHFSEQQITLLTFAISIMNAMNRVAIGFGREPQVTDAW